MNAHPGCDRVVLAIDQTEVTDVLELGKEVLSRAGCVKISTHLVQRMAPGRAALFVRNMVPARSSTTLVSSTTVRTTSRPTSASCAATGARRSARPSS
jgi:hypothetical protein